LSYTVRLTADAREDLLRLENFLVDTALRHGDFDLPMRAMTVIEREFRILERNPFTCRIASRDRMEQELVIPFGTSGYVALFHILDNTEVVVSAIRHQREDDYH